MVEGSCLRGGIAFEVDEVAMISVCHCSLCRKSRGSAFGTTASVRAPAFPLHIFVGSRAPWWEITDGAPQFEEWVPGYEPE